MKRIGITQRVEHLADRGERRDCLDQEWGRLLFDAGFVPVPLPNRVGDTRRLLEELQLAGVILSGGNDIAALADATNTAPERDRFERELLDCCADMGVPVLGVCRGLQLMIHHAGGEVVPLKGHVRAPHAIEVVQPGIPALTDRDEVNSFHGFGVHANALGEAMQAVARAPDGSIEAVAHAHLLRWGIMWHPERAPYDPGDVEIIQALFGRNAH